MGDCVYCRESAGIFKSRHDACEGLVRSAIDDLVDSGGDETSDELEAKAVSFLERGKQLGRGEAGAYRCLLAAIWGAVEQADYDELTSDGPHNADRLTTLVLASDDPYLQDDYVPASKLTNAITLLQAQRGEIALREVDPPDGLNLPEDEQTRWCERATYYKERTHRSFAGGSTGASVRVTRGVYWRVGAMRGYPIETSTLDLTDVGKLALTESALYWIGEHNAFRVPTSKILAFQPYADGLGIQRGGANSRPEVFVSADGAFDGKFLYNLIQNLLHVPQSSEDEAANARHRREVIRIANGPPIASEADLAPILFFDTQAGELISRLTRRPATRASDRIDEAELLNATADALDSLRLAMEQELATQAFAFAVKEALLLAKAIVAAACLVCTVLGAPTDREWVHSGLVEAKGQLREAEDQRADLTELVRTAIPSFESAVYLAALAGLVEGRLAELTAPTQGGSGAPREDLLNKLEQLGRLRDKVC